MSDRFVDMTVYVREKVGYRDDREPKKYGKNIDWFLYTQVRENKKS